MTEKVRGHTYSEPAITPECHGRSRRIATKGVCMREKEKEKRRYGKEGREKKGGGLRDGKESRP